MPCIPARRQSTLLTNLNLDSAHFARTADILKRTERKKILSVGGGRGFCESCILPAPICRDENRTKIVGFDESTQCRVTDVPTTGNLLSPLFLVRQSHRQGDTWRYENTRQNGTPSSRPHTWWMLNNIARSVRRYAWNHTRNAKRTLMKSDIKAI